MFKVENFENELMQQMEKNLVRNEAENRWSFDKIAKAAEYISFAAEIFDDTGMHKEAEMLTLMLEKIASTESDRLARNVVETGTPFSMKEYHHADANKADNSKDPLEMEVLGLDEDEGDESFADDGDFEEEV